MSKEKYGFVYIWRDKKHNRYYIGCHWGSVDDGYICSSNWMRTAYKRRPEDFKRRILKTNISHRPDIYIEEQKFFDKIKPEEIKIRYYNLCLANKNVWHKDSGNVKTIGQKISASKMGKSNGPCTPERAAKISAGKKGAVFSEEHKKKLSDAKIGRKLSPEHREKVIRTLRHEKKEPKPKTTMSRTDQDNLCSFRMKLKWADPIWAANQRNSLKLARNNRKNKS